MPTERSTWTWQGDDPDKPISKDDPQDGDGTHVILVKGWFKEKNTAADALVGLTDTFNAAKVTQAASAEVQKKAADDLIAKKSVEELQYGALNLSNVGAVMAHDAAHDKVSYKPDKDDPPPG